jgi:hypothetical protein
VPGPVGEDVERFEDPAQCPGRHIDHRIELLTSQDFDRAGLVTVDVNELGALGCWTRLAARGAYHLVPPRDRVQSDLLGQKGRATEHKKTHGRHAHR